ncbi:hypothetical protein ACKWRH_08250 [Bradyrhizobium sp. Pa8]|uniref:hypothetical protein n=1 Tax=Bradyrhizobium sp. Pa8 TaxID=3386552 RepID=UPI00403F0BD2
MPFLLRLPQEVPHVSSFKIEVPFAAAKLRSLIELGSEAIMGSFDGEEPTTMTGGPRCRRDWNDVERTASGSDPPRD